MVTKFTAAGNLLSGVLRCVFDGGRVMKLKIYLRRMQCLNFRYLTAESLVKTAIGRGDQKRRFAA